MFGLRVDHLLLHCWMAAHLRVAGPESVRCTMGDAKQRKPAIEAELGIGKTFKFLIMCMLGSWNLLSPDCEVVNRMTLEIRYTCKATCFIKAATIRRILYVNTCWI